MIFEMNRTRNLFRYIPRRYRVYVCVIVLICPCIYFIYPDSSPHIHVEIIGDHVDELDLYDDDDMPLTCPSEIQFFKSNCQHLVILLASKLLPFIWRNFRALLCSGVDVYVMFDEVFPINSSLRVDDYKARHHRSQRSYSHRFLYVKNQYLEKFGVKYMKRLPSVEYTSWDRVTVWLYHRVHLKNAWIVEYDVQWFDVRNMTNLFDSYSNDTTDLLCDNIVPTDSYWSMWPSTQSDIFPKSYWIGTFSPLVRWSRRLLQHHYRYMQLIHKDRLRYDLNNMFRFQEFIMGTIVKTDNLSIAVYSEHKTYIHIVLENMRDAEILSHLRAGRYILHPVKQDSILTNYGIEDLTKMIQMNSLILINKTLLKKKGSSKTMTKRRQR